MEEQEQLMVDEKEMAQYIQDRLLSQGVAVKEEDILLILSLEMEFMIEKGIVTIEDV